jgi:hypothetical protein
MGVPGQDPGVEQWIAKVDGHRVCDVQNQGECRHQHCHAEKAGRNPETVWSVGHPTQDSLRQHGVLDAVCHAQDRATRLHATCSLEACGVQRDATVVSASCSLRK